MVEENAERKSAETPTKKPRRMNPKSLANLVAPWTSENHPVGGRPKKDVASEIAAQAFENNKEAIYKAAVNALLKGNPYAFDVYANRAFGKLKEKIELGGDEELLSRLVAGRKRAAQKVTNE